MMKMVRFVLVTAALLMIANLAGAQDGKTTIDKTKPNPSVNKSALNDKLPKPKPGFGHAMGTMIYNGEKKKGLTVTLLRIGGGPQASGESPKAETDENGRWVTLNIEPGKYCPMVITKPGIPYAFSEKDIKELFKDVKEGAVTDFGDVKRAE